MKLTLEELLNPLSFTEIAIHAAAKRRTFIGGSDARVIMGDDEAALVRLSRDRRHIPGSTVPRRTRLPQSHTRSSAVFVNELDPSDLKAASDDFKRRSAGSMHVRLELAHRHNPNSSAISELLLTPIEEPTRGSALLWGDHVPRIHEKPNSSIVSKID